MTAGAEMQTIDLIADGPRSEPGELAAPFAAMRSRLGAEAPTVVPQCHRA
jgi:hypothetical protein